MCKWGTCALVLLIGLGLKPAYAHDDEHHGAASVATKTAAELPSHRLEVVSPDVYLADKSQPKIDPFAAWVPPSNACAVPLIDKIQCCTWSTRNVSTGSDETFRPAYREFATNLGWSKETPLTAAQHTQTVTKAKNFHAGLKARMVFHEPYDSGDAAAGSTIGLASGWFYGYSGTTPEVTENGRQYADGHGGLDYTRRPIAEGEDPTFKVRAVAAGKVIQVDWTSLTGGVVVVAHTAPDGTQYRSIYAHVRNGAKADLAKALALPITYLEDGVTPDMTNRETRYRLFADKEKQYADRNGGTPRVIYWGTESQVIAVKEGDTVQAGQFLAWSGNTGAGGAGNSLPQSTPGEFSSGAKNTGNNHLHFYFGVQHPDGLANSFILIDPYGVYSEAGNDCYELFKKESYRRFFAPHYSTFSRLDTGRLSHYFYYYPGMDMALQTLSIHRSGTGYKATGSFNLGVPSLWKARYFMTATQFDSVRDTYSAAGLRPRELSVAVDSAGAEQVTALWARKGVANEPFVAKVGMTDSAFSGLWTTLVTNNGYRVEDHFSYTKSGERYHAAIFVKDGSTDFYYPHNYSWGDYWNFYTGKKALGYAPVTTDVEELPWGVRYGGLMRKMGGTWELHTDLTFDGFNQKHLFYRNQGYRLHRVQGYSNSTKYMGIWRKTFCPVGQGTDFNGKCVAQ